MEQCDSTKPQAEYLIFLQLLIPQASHFSFLH